jgi:hypothetical protein
VIRTPAPDRFPKKQIRQRLDRSISRLDNLPLAGERIE